MLAQAEHDTDASAILVTTSKRLATAVAREVDRQLADLPTAPTARVAIEKNSVMILVKSIERAMEISNRFAPEHLSIPDASLVRLVTSAGSVFVGPHSRVAGDYASDRTTCCRLRAPPAYAPVCRPPIS
jgi:histidinol dehydrogenase